ncbi:MAG: prefoldin subunit alpha [Nanoarchaeota archaeon]
MNNIEMNPQQQAVIMELQMIEQKMKQLEAQISAIQKQTGEMEGIIESLAAVERNNGEEMLLPIGKGIFIKNKPTSKNVLLNIGSGTVIEKDIKGTIKLIDEQITKLNEMAAEYQLEMMKSEKKIEEMIEGIQKTQQ